MFTIYGSNFTEIKATRSFRTPRICQWNQRITSLTLEINHLIDEAHFEMDGYGKATNDS